MKRKIRRTGEIIDVITFNGSTIRRDYDKIQFYDSNGSVINESLNYYLDTLPVDDENKDVDWEQRRFDLVKAYSIEFIKMQDRKRRNRLRSIYTRCGVMVYNYSG